MRWLSMASKTNYQQLSGLKNKPLMMSQFWLAVGTPTWVPLGGILLEEPAFPAFSSFQRPGIPGRPGPMALPPSSKPRPFFPSQSPSNRGPERMRAAQDPRHWATPPGSSGIAFLPREVTKAQVPRQRTWTSLHHCLPQVGSTKSVTMNPNGCGSAGYALRNYWLGKGCETGSPGPTSPGRQGNGGLQLN